jgi:hypothetical protein
MIVAYRSSVRSRDSWAWWCFLVLGKCIGLDLQSSQTHDDDAARYPIGCGSSSVRGMLLSVSKCRTLLSVLSFSLSHSVGYTSVGWLGRDSDSILYNTNSSHAPLAQTTVGWLGRDSDSILYNTNSSHAPLAQTTGDRRRAGRYRRRWQADSRQTGGEWADTDCTSGTSVSCNKCNTLLTLLYFTFGVELSRPPEMDLRVYE